MLGYRVEEVSILPVVYPFGTVSVSSLGSFSSVGSSSKTSHPSVHLSIRSCHIQDYSKKKKGREKNSLSNSRRRPGMRIRLSEVMW